jgi:chromosome segregation ATPase
MSTKRLKNSYYIKDARGKLIILSEDSLLSMILGKSIKPGTKVFNKEFNRWMKVSDLSAYKNKQHIIDTEVIDSIEDVVEADSETEQIISLMDNLEDAKEIIFKTRFEGYEQYKNIVTKYSELETKLHSTLNKLHSLELENNVLNTSLEQLHEERIELLKDAKLKNNDLQITKLEAKVAKLKKELKLVQLEHKSEIELNNKLLIHNETLRNEAIELYERKEYHEIQFKKIEKDKLHYNENIELYKQEIEKLNIERDIIQNQFDELLEKYKKHHSDLNDHRELKIEHKAQVEAINSRNLVLSNTLEVHKTKINKQNQEIHHLKVQLSEFQSKVMLLEAEARQKDNIIEDLKDVPPMPIVNSNEKLRELESKLAKLEAEVKIKEDIIASKDIVIASKDSSIESSQDEIKNQKIELKILKDKEAEIKKNTVDLKTFTAVEKKLKYIENSYNLLFNKAKVIASKWQMAQKEVNKLKEQKDQRTPKVISKDQVQPSQVKTNDTIVTIKDDQKIEEHIRQVEQSAKKNLLLTTEGVGKLFKLNGESTWKINLPDYKNEIYNIFELKELIKEKKVNSKVKVKSLGHPWKSIEDCLELNTDIISKETHGVTEYYIERKNVRAPVHQLVQVTYEGDKATGICTNISQNGCLVEIQESPFLLVSGIKINLQFQFDDGQLLDVDCILRNVNDEMGVFAIGLQFEETTEFFQQWLEQQISKFTGSLNLKQAA